MLKNFQKTTNSFKQTQKLLKQFSSTELSRGLNRQKYTYQIGDVVENFVVTDIEEIPDFQFKAYHLEHQKTKTKFMHIDSPDLNNCMSIIFKTIPNNDKGTPHILEHLACCGGEMYPVRDPFMKMLKRSLNTYMNAWTGSDFTAYPFSSQNSKDFKNLMSVYLDISLKSLLKKTDFLQEGWRYDFNDKGELQYKGVVFNEMKGVYQTQDSVLNEEVSKNLFKNSIYTHSSGGNPPDITDLSYEEVKDFYQKYYHPSNAKIFSYGDLNFAEHLQYIDQTYLQHFEQQEPAGDIQLSERFEQPKKNLIFRGPPDSMSLDAEAQCSFGLTFLCNNIVENHIETLGLQVLSHLLFQSPNGPLYKALIENGHAPAFISGNGYESYSKEGSFTIGVSGIKEENAEEIEKIIFEVLKNQVKFDEELIESVLHMIELDSKVPKSNFGLNILMHVLNNYNHGGKVLSALDVSNNIKTLREQILNENLLQKLTDKFLLQNQHYIQYKMLPDEQYQQKIEEQEKNKLLAIEEKLTEQEKTEITQINQQLKEEQEQEEQQDDANLLPSLSLNDIEVKVEEVKFEEDLIDEQIPVFFTKQPTNGVTFLRMKLDIKEVPYYVRQYIDLFTNIMTQIGSKKYNKDKMSTMLNLYTSGFNVYFESSLDKNDATKVQNHVVFSIACIDRNIGKMMELFRELLISPDFKDVEHIMTIIKNNATVLGQNMVDSSMNYAQSRANASMREKYFVNERLESTRFQCNLGKNVQKSTSVTAKLYMEDLEFQFSSILQFLMHKNKMSFQISSDKDESANKLKFELLRFIDQAKVQYGSFERKDGDQYFTEDNPNPFQKNIIKQYYKLPMQVNYVIQSLQVPHYTHADCPQMHLLSQILTNKVLHREIREKGGAYGGGSKLGDGVLTFYSYRDPNTIDTLNAFDLSIKEISEGNFNDQDIKEAKFSVFQNIDKVVTPQRKGLSYFFNGITAQDKLFYRQCLIGSNKQLLVDAAQNYLLKAQQENQISKVIFGADNAEQYNQLQEQGWEILKAIE